MRSYLLIGFACLFTTVTLAQTRSNMVYAGFGSGLNVGLDHAVQLTKRSYTSGRIYFVVSPNFQRTGYGTTFSDVDEKVYSKSKFEKYEIVLPVHLRFELAPNRIIMGRSPGKHDADIAVFFDVGLSLNYMVGGHLHEDFTQTAGGTFPFVFDGAIKPLTSRLTANYLTFNIGMRYNRFAFFMRAYQPFTETKYTNLSSDWGMPPGVKSFFYDKWLVDPYYKQPTVFLCLAYTY